MTFFGGGAVCVISEKNVLQTDFEPNKKSCKEIPVIQWLSMSYHMETLNLTSSQPLFKTFACFDWKFVNVVFGDLSSVFRHFLKIYSYINSQVTAPLPGNEVAIILWAICHRIHCILFTSSKYGKRQVVLKNKLGDWSQSGTAKYFEQEA